MNIGPNPSESEPVRRPLAVLLLCALALTFFPLTAPQAKEQKPTLVDADELVYDQNTNIVTALGHAEVSQGDQILRADKIVYEQEKDIVHAEGHVVLLQPTGEVMFANQLELTHDLNEGYVENVGILFNDNSRLVAANAQRYEGRYFVAERGLYTACDVCASDPTSPPLWQIRANRVSDDNDTQDSVYTDATIEFGGVPLFYTPYFAHPDPRVKRRQGFLSPSAGSTQNLGFFTKVPYYFDIAPETDATLMPTFSAKDKAQFAGEIRHRFDAGQVQFSGSFAHADLIDDLGVDQGQQLRGHLFGSSLFNLNNEWRAGTNVAFTSDKSYLQRYNISSEDVLVNRAYIEDFHGRNYASGNMYYFQDLRPGTQLTEPFVAPQLNYSAYGEPGKTLGGRWSLDANFLMTRRDRDVSLAQQGPDTRRLGVGAGWQRQLISNTGLVTQLNGLVREDGYWADNVQDPTSPTTRYDGALTLRQFAQGDVTFRYPLGRRGNGYDHIIEPIAMITAAPRVDNDPKIPNEDSLDVEFDETNLFSPNRFTGIDRLEGGMRGTYGLRQAFIGDGGERLDMLAGESYRLTRNNDFPGGSGLRDQLSDYVGRIDLVPGDWLDLNYGFRLNRDDYSFIRQELRATAGVPLFRPTINYLKTEQTDANGVTGPVEEVTPGFSSTFYKYYTLSAYHRRALAPDAGPRLTSISLNYQDECFTFGITAQRDHTQRADVKSGDSILFRFYLKNVGGFQTDSVNPNASMIPGSPR